MPIVTRFTVNQAGVQQMVRSPNQPVPLHMANVGRQLAAACRREAPRGKGEGPHLADNINSKLIPTSQGLAVQVVFGVPHAIYVINGTKAHSIGSPVLVAPGVWRYIGLSPSGAGKIHPGTAPNDFPSRAAASIGLRLNRLGRR